MDEFVLGMLQHGDAEVVNENGGGVLQFTASEKAAWSISQDDVLKDLDIEKLSLGCELIKMWLIIVVRLERGVHQEV